MSREGPEPFLDVVGFPRVSGDEPPTQLTIKDSQLFSPRERG